MSSRPARTLETVPNPAPSRPYRVRMVAPEFTAVCPRTGQPDFGTIVIEYVPGPRLVELKSLKLYLWSFRDEGIFHEAVINKILEDFSIAADPQWVSITGFFKVRGGITTTVAAQSGSLPKNVAEFATPPRPEEG